MKISALTSREIDQSEPRPDAAPSRGADARRVSAVIVGANFLTPD